MKNLRTVLRPQGPGQINDDFNASKRALLLTDEHCEIISVLHVQCGVSIRTLSDATGVSYRVARKWVITNTAPPADVELALENLKAIVGFLMMTGMLYREEIVRFLNARNPDMGYRRPITTLRDSDIEPTIKLCSDLVARLMGMGGGEEEVAF